MTLVSPTTAGHGAMGMCGQWVGGSSTSVTLNSANAWLAFALPVTGPDLTLNTVRVYCPTNNGTQANIGVSANLCGETSTGLPDSGNIIETRSIAVGNWSAAPFYPEFTGFSTALTAGSRYWVVLKNLASAPATDYPSITQPTTGALPTVGGCITSNANTGWATVQTTDGSAWTTSPRSASGGALWGFSNGGYAGITGPSTSSSMSTKYVYGSRECGAKFTTPPVVKLRVTGLAFNLYKAGTPTQKIRFRLYEGDTLLATTYAGPPVGATPTAGGWVTLFFSSVQVLKPATSYRAVVGEESNSDTVGNMYIPCGASIPDLASQRSVLPFGGTMQMCYLDGTWTDYNVNVPWMGLVLDASDLYGPLAKHTGDLSGGL